MTSVAPNINPLALSGVAPSLPAVTVPLTARKPPPPSADRQHQQPQSLTARRPSGANLNGTVPNSSQNAVTSGGIGMPPLGGAFSVGTHLYSGGNGTGNTNAASAALLPPISGGAVGTGAPAGASSGGVVTLGSASNTNANVAATSPATVHGTNSAAHLAGGSSSASTTVPPAASTAVSAIGSSAPSEPSSSIFNDLANYASTLTQHEKEEMRTYGERYYFGQNCKDKVQSPVAGGINFGYDDDRGDYSLILYDHVAYRYEIVGFLGKGSFGQVAKVFDHKRQTLMALKVLRNKKKFHQQAQVEIKILQHLRHRDPDGKYGIVQIYDTFTFRNHICLTYELLSINLYEYLKNNKFTPMPLPVVKKIGASVLISLAFMWREGIIHCDLKPENILLRQPNRTAVKVIDLGSACFENERLYTYIQSRFYRAPEVMLGIPYTRRIDLWSFACVLCELATGIPIFPGESELEQMGLVMEYLNVPPPEIVSQSPHRNKFFELSGAPKLVQNSRKKIRIPNTKTLHGFLGLSADDLFVSFIKMFLTWDPEERPAPEVAMRHPWVCDAYVGLTPSMPVVKRRYVPVAERNGANPVTNANAGGLSSPRFGGSGSGSVPTSPRVGDHSNKHSATGGASSKKKAGGAVLQNQEDGSANMYSNTTPRLPTVPQPKTKNPRKVPGT